MGSYGDTWLKCTWCTRDGKCQTRRMCGDHIPSLLDIDGVGLLCDLCYDSAYPRLTVWFFRKKFPSLVAEAIERMAYPVWVKYHSINLS